MPPLSLFLIWLDPSKSEDYRKGTRFVKDKYYLITLIHNRLAIRGVPFPTRTENHSRRIWP